MALGFVLVLGGGVAFMVHGAAPEVEQVAVNPIEPPKPVEPKPVDAKPVEDKPAVAAVTPTPPPVAIAPKPIDPPKPMEPPKPVESPRSKGGHVTHASAHEKHLKTEVAVATHAPAPTPAPAPPPAANGRIEIRVLPFAEDVIVDGKHFGPTPVSPDVTSGKHHVTLVRQTEKFEADVVVPGNGSVVIKHKFNTD